MSTRTRIGRINPSGSITSIYTHWDGYPSHHLPILTQHYSSEARINALLALGSLSSLAPELGDKHDFDDRDHRDWCTAHGRDRNDRDCAAMTSRNEIAFAAACADCWAEYAYLWNGIQWKSHEVVDRPLPHLVLLTTVQLQREAMQ